MKRTKIFCLVISAMLVFHATALQSCSKYTVTTSQKDPADIHFKQKTMASYFWGTVNNPHRAVDSTCGSAGLDEVRITTSLGYSFINVVTLGIVNIVKVRWKCHKPAPIIGH